MQFATLVIVLGLFGGTLLFDLISSRVKTPRWTTELHITGGVGTASWFTPAHKPSS